MTRAPDVALVALFGMIVTTVIGLATVAVEIRDLLRRPHR